MIAFITDTHFGCQKSNKEFFHYQMDFYKKQFFPYLLENNIKTVIHLGDLLDNRTETNIYINQKLHEQFFSFFEKHGVKMYFIPGNHDVYLKASNEISYAYTLNYKMFHIIDKPKILNFEGLNIGFIPWGMEDKLPQPEAVDILCGHFEINGILKNKFDMGSGRLKVSDFSEYPLVLSGHYHVPSLTNNIQYLGSPQQMDRNDYGANKGFWVLSDGVLNFVENTISPKFVNVTYEEDGKNLKVIVDNGLQKKEFANSEQATEFINHDFTDVFVHKYINEALLDKFLGDIKNNKRFKNYEVLDAIEKDIVIVEDGKGNLQICIDFITQVSFEDGIEKDFIINRFGKLYEVAKYKMGGE